MLEELLEAWRTNDRINLYLIDRIDEDGMACTLSKRGGRDVCRQFAHLQNVRVDHLIRWDKRLAEGMRKFETKERPDRETLKAALTASGERLAQWFAAAARGETRTRGTKKGLITTLAYFVAHESHHRGSILLTLKECGHKVDQETAYAIWDWDRL
ncbi:MAG TPA: DinB family protein [Symbiobacteriaceae bacterium]|nr:DinB family protein [Symbiobacteriaceae bacterium]